MKPPIFHLQSSTASRQLVIFALLAILLLAAALRFYRLDDLPPGLWFDEAWSSVAARNSAAQGAYPVYYAASFGGMHPAIVYLARLVHALSDNPLSLRYAVAAVSTLTIAVSFFAYRAIFTLDGRKPYSVNRNPKSEIPNQFIIHNSQFIIPTLILAITYPFLHFSRMGFESSFPVLAGLLLFWSLAVALQRERAGWFALTGGVLGLSLYSFDTARFFPFALSVAFWGVVLVHGRQAWRRYLGWYVLLAVTAVLVFLPLGLYALTHWDAFAGRAGIATYNTLGPGAASVPLALLRNVGRTLGGLVLPGLGDVIARHNLPGRPVFDPFLAILFVGGLARLVWTWRRPSSIILASWAGVMLLPVVLTDGAPTYTRIFGALPALAAIAGLSGEWGVRSAEPGRRSALRTLHSPLVFFLLTISLAVTVRDYFGRWAAVPQLFDDFQVAEWQAGQLALAGLEAGDVFIVPHQIDDAPPTLDWLLRDTAVRSLPPDCYIYSTGEERPFTYLIHTPSAPDTLPALQTTFPTGQPGPTIVSPLTGQTLYQTFKGQWSMVNSQSSTAVSQSEIRNPKSEIIFSPALQLANSPIISVTETAVLIPLVWYAADQPTADHTLFVHLYPAGQENGPPLAQLDVQPCLPTAQWRPGDAITETYALPLPPDLPPGDYTLAMGWYTWPSFERLPVSGTTAVLSNDRLFLQSLALP
jgi:hypothetical protein